MYFNIISTATKHVGHEHIKAVSIEKKIEIKTKKRVLQE